MKRLLSLALIFTCLATSAQAAGIDETINSAVQPLTDIVSSIVASLAADYDPVWGSQVKQTIRRVHPSFAESYYGFKSFSDLLEAAEKEGRVVLDFDQERGNFKVTLGGK